MKSQALSDPNQEVDEMNAHFVAGWILASVLTFIACNPQSCLIFCSRRLSHCWSCLRERLKNGDSPTCYCVLSAVSSMWTVRRYFVLGFRRVGKSGTPR